MSYSYSGLARLQQCERSFALHYREGLRRPEIQPWAMMRGSAWHAVMAVEALGWGAEAGTLLYAPKSIKVVDGLELTVPESWSVEGVVSALAVWEVQQGGQFMDEMREEYGDLLSARIANLWDRFSDGKTPVELFGHPLLVEYAWERKLPNGLNFRGVADLVFFDPVDEMIVVRDWKLHEAWPQTPPAIEDLVNSQLHLTAWGVAEDLRNLAKDNDVVPEAVEYARARFKKPATPTLTKATPKTPSRLSKSTTDYDAYTYAEFCRDPETVAAGYCIDFEHYEQLLMQREKWFRLQRKPLLYNVYSQHVLAAASQAERAETITTESSVASYGSHCARCEYSQLCRADLMGGRQDYAEVDPNDFNLVRKVQ
jgi:hypothetical protein